jgi:hypothetical protein
LGANLLIAVGCTIAFVGLLGSISISKENDIFLFIYAALMFCVFGLYVTCAIWGFVRLDYVKLKKILIKFTFLYKILTINLNTIES